MLSRRKAPVSQLPPTLACLGHVCIRDRRGGQGVYPTINRVGIQAWASSPGGRGTAGLHADTGAGVQAEPLVPERCDEQNRRLLLAKASVHTIQGGAVAQTDRFVGRQGSSLMAQPTWSFLTPADPGREIILGSSVFDGTVSWRTGSRNVQEGHADLGKPNTGPVERRGTGPHTGDNHHSLGLLRVTAKTASCLRRKACVPTPQGDGAIGGGCGVARPPPACLRVKCGVPSHGLNRSRPDFVPLRPIKPNPK